MTQKATFTKDMVVEAAFSIVRESGWAAVKARNIAARLGSSTMPIYSSLHSMDEIAKAVWEKALGLMIDYQTRQYTDNVALNLAIGYVAFAKHEPRLFRFMYLERPQSVTEQDMDHAVENMQKLISVGDAVLNAIKFAPPDMQNPLAFKTWIFTHGLASLVSGGALQIPEERIETLLQEAGGAFFALQEQQRKGGHRE